MKYLFVFMALVVVLSNAETYPTANAAVAPSSIAQPVQGPQPFSCDACHGG